MRRAGPRPGDRSWSFFTAGSWDSGSKAEYARVGDALARQGYVAILPDYRVFPEALYQHPDRISPGLTTPALAMLF
jgi:acetyl esterase/lipase